MPPRPRDATGAHVELVEDLIQQVTTRLLDPLAILLDDDAITGICERTRIDAEVWAAQLLGGDEHRATETATRLIAALFADDQVFDPQPRWWATPFGRAVLHSIGHPAREHVTFAAAGAMLGISRQGVHDLLTRDKLQRHPDGGVTTASIRARSIQRNPPHAKPAPASRSSTCPSP
ncbi:hypothetical protein F7O44_21135 [Phytoactinopolyspora sp. XMNu-373]|uniref:Uncharacterized protein n=1 Tax=Phytoactinopolyspora mesophila TaxID=2650750 RepID=A0A7K3M8A4_9ACTN|nr:hypothetical protein [Phytoactinopolyspora mesophila]